VVEVAKAKVAYLLIRNIGRTKHASTVVRRDTRHPAARAKLAVANDNDSASIAQSIKKLTKDTKNLKKAFTQLQKTSERDSNLSGSESEEQDSHFQFDDGFQFTQRNRWQSNLNCVLPNSSNKLMAPGSNLTLRRLYSWIASPL
jgi:hypothetical protein